jgi:hypothetical protein
MPRPTTEQFEDRFAVGLTLDHLWCETMGLPIDDKEKVLASLVAVLEFAGTPYAVIGGVAMQLYTEEPRTTADVDIALRSHEDLPRKNLEEVGFSPDGIHEWSENWRGPAPAGTPRKRRVAVQFSSDHLMVAAVAHAEKASVGRFSFQLATIPDLILLKLAAAEEPKGRTSKKIHDVGDVIRLLEDHPELDSPEIRARLSRVRSTF